MSNSLVVSHLPTKGRSYPGILSISTRGLKFHETKALARFVSNGSTDNLANLYKDVIQGIDVLDLEMVDFTVLIMISSIWTVDNFSWNPKIKCNHLTADNEVCGGEHLLHPVTLDDLDFDNDSLQTVREVPITVAEGEDGWLYRPINVRRKIEMERYLDIIKSSGTIVGDELEDVEDYAKFAALIVSAGEDHIPFEERVERIKLSTSDEIRDIAKMDEEMRVSIRPVVATCASCHKELRVRMGLESLRRHP